WIYYTFSGNRGYQYDFALESWYQIEPPAHPYLYFTADDIPAIRERMNHPAFLFRRNRLLSGAETLLNRNPATDSRSSQGNSGLLAFAYIVTGEEKYAKRAIQEALA